MEIQEDCLKGLENRKPMKTIGFHGWGRQKDAIADLPLWGGANRIDATSFVSWWPQYATGILHLDGFES